MITQPHALEPNRARARRQRRVRVQYLLMGTMNHGGVLMSKVIGRPNERVTTKLEARTDPADFSQSVYMADAEWSGDTWSGQVKMGTGGFYGGNAMFAVSEHFSGGAELFSLGKQRRSGMGGVLRYATSKCVGTLQVRRYPGITVLSPVMQAEGLELVTNGRLTLHSAPRIDCVGWYVACRSPRRASCQQRTTSA